MSRASGKQDARVRYTRMIIRNSLFECLEEEGSITRLTVKQVCERADINRATFYRHFKDCFDVVDQIIEEEISDYRSLLDEIDGVFSPELTERYVTILNKYEDLHSAYLAGRLHSNLQEQLVKASCERYMELWKGKVPEERERELEMFHYAASAAYFQLVLSEREKFPLEESLPFLRCLITSGIEHYMK